MDTIISIIIPVYNSQKYLSRCIESILNQTFRNFEVILINDGSTDKSISICNNYIEIDQRVKLINQVNTGVSCARNRGIDEAVGRYIMFVDSDDTIEEDMVEYLYNLIIKKDYDVAVCQYTLYKDGHDSKKKRKKEILEYYSNEKIMEEYIVSNLFRYSPVNKLYKKSLIIQNNIRFLTEIKYSEDAIFNYEIFSRVDKIIYSSESKYNYYLNEHSTVRTVTEKRLDILHGIVKIYYLISNRYPKYRYKISNNFIESSVAIIIDIINENKVFEKRDLIKDVGKILTENSFIYKGEKKLSIRNRLYVNLFSFSPWIIVGLYKGRFLILRLWGK